MWLISSEFGSLSLLLFFFFFQAEDGIRDHCVTGVQTCALPILLLAAEARFHHHLLAVMRPAFDKRRGCKHDRLACLGFHSSQMLIVKEVAGIQIGRASCRERVWIGEGDDSLEKKMK